MVDHRLAMRRKAFQAIAAAEEVAEFKDTIAEIKSTLRLHTWILTFNTAMIIALVGRLFLGGH